MSRVSRQDLELLVPRKAWFVGVDSDGCVFDTMEVKQKQFFHPAIVETWHLGPYEGTVREVAEFVNLRSVWRGQNRFPALLKVFELLHEHPALVGCRERLPALEPLQRYIRSGLPLGNPSLQTFIEQHPEPELKRLLAWSLAINASIASEMPPVPPFDGARETLARMAEDADLVVVSQTPEEALVNEWQKHGLCAWIRLIAGQEMGTKDEHLALATQGRYRKTNVLMIGDAPGDQRAANAVGACFYPIIPGHEEGCWARLRDEAFGRFLEGRYAGRYEDARISAFAESLPSVPPWENDG